MSRAPRPQWTARDAESAAKLELPLLLLLKRDDPQAVQALRDRLGHDKATLERSLRWLCSRGLAHRREQVHSAKFYPLANGEGETACTEEKVIRRWILSERGEVWRDLRISRGDLAQLSERYQALALGANANLLHVSQ
jgi:hypothetical protein